MRKRTAVTLLCALAGTTNVVASNEGVTEAYCLLAAAKEELAKNSHYLKDHPFSLGPWVSSDAILDGHRKCLSEAEDSAPKEGKTPRKETLTVRG